MAFGCSVAGPLVKSVSPMTRASAGRIDDHEVIRRHRPQADGVGRIRLVGPGPSRELAGHALACLRIIRAVHQPLLGQDAENLLHVVAPERFGAGERQLERRALDVIHQDVQVVGIDERPLGRRVEEIRRVADDELIERRAAGDHHRRRPARAPSRAAGALPRRGNRARIAGHHADVERADVDAELEGIGGHDGADAALPQAFLDFAAPLRQIAAAVSADALRCAGRSFEIVLQVRRQDFGGQPALREHDELEVPLQELRGDPPRFAQIRPPDAELMVDDGRVDEDEELLAARRAASVDELEGLLSVSRSASSRGLAIVADEQMKDRDSTRSAGRCAAAGAARCTDGCQRRRDRRAARR